MLPNSFFGTLPYKDDKRRHHGKWSSLILPSQPGPGHMVLSATPHIVLVSWQSPLQCFWTRRQRPSQLPFSCSMCLPVPCPSSAAEHPVGLLLLKNEANSPLTSPALHCGGQRQVLHGISRFPNEDKSLHRAADGVQVRTLQRSLNAMINK